MTLNHDETRLIEVYRSLTETAQRLLYQIAITLSYDPTFENATQKKSYKGMEILFTWTTGKNDPTLRKELIGFYTIKQRVVDLPHF